jgi:uncharacterized membrane protein SirB2
MEDVAASTHILCVCVCVYLYRVRDIVLLAARKARKSRTFGILTRLLELLGYTIAVYMLLLSLGATMAQRTGGRECLDEVLN